MLSIIHFLHFPGVCFTALLQPDWLVFYLSCFIVKAFKLPSELPLATLWRFCLENSRGPSSLNNLQTSFHFLSNQKVIYKGICLMSRVLISKSYFTVPTRTHTHTPHPCSLEVTSLRMHMLTLTDACDLISCIPHPRSSAGSHWMP